MKDNTPTLEEWRKLYEATTDIRELAPWEWMREDIIFGVQNPETGKLGFVSVMGALGEHFAVAVYLGAEGLYKFWKMQASDPSDTPESIVETPQLQASFEDRNTLRKQDRDVIKQLGLKFRGRNEWPMFRSYRPGFLPWFVEGEEARFLACALEQALHVIPRLEEDLSLLGPPDDTSYLVRVPQQQGDSLTWQDEIMSVLPPEPVPIPIVLDIELLDALKNRPQGPHTLEADFFIMPGGIRDGTARPFFAYVAMVVEAQNGFVLGSELLYVETTLEDMWGQVPGHILSRMAMLGDVPRRITVRTPLLWQLLQPLAEELGFEVELADILPNLDEVKAHMFDRMM